MAFRFIDRVRIVWAKLSFEFRAFEQLFDYPDIQSPSYADKINPIGAYKSTGGVQLSGHRPRPMRIPVCLGGSCEQWSIIEVQGDLIFENSAQINDVGIGNLKFLQVRRGTIFHLNKA